MQLERLAREGSTKIASRNDKPEDVLTNYQGNWLGWVDLITGLAVKRAKKLRSRVHGFNPNPNSISFEQSRESSPNTYLNR